jgi:hypothetical protein
VGPTAVSRWLAGDNYPELRTLKKIGAAYSWPARDQVDLIPIEGHDETWASAFREVLNAHYGGEEIKDRGMFKVQVRVARTIADLGKIIAGSRIVTNDNKLMERDQNGPGMRRYWIEAGTLDRIDKPREEWLPAYVLPAAEHQ